MTLFFSSVGGLYFTEGNSCLGFSRFIADFYIMFLQCSCQRFCDSFDIWQCGISIAGFLRLNQFKE